MNAKTIDERLVYIFADGPEGELAIKAVRCCEQRKDENVQEWAERLAADVANAND